MTVGNQLEVGAAEDQHQAYCRWHLRPCERTELQLFGRSLYALGLRSCLCRHATQM